MANRRMFSKAIVLDDDFLDLSKDAKLLYFLLGMEADDDGFLKSSKRICKTNDIEESTLEELVEKGFIMRFPSGVLCITDWCRNNQIQKDRHTPTEFIEGKLVEKKNGKYHLKNTTDTPCIQNVSNMDTPCIQDDNTMETQVSIGKVSIGKNSSDKSSIEQERLGEGREEKNNTDKHILSGKPDGVSEEEWENIKIIIDYLNQKTGKHFKPDTKQTQELIVAWLKQGFTVDDFKTAIDKKSWEWLHAQPEYEKYLRPNTLFGNNFESYVNQPDSPFNHIKDNAGQTINREAQPLESSDVPSWMMNSFGKALDNDERQELSNLVSQYGEKTIKEGLDKLADMRKKTSNQRPYTIQYLSSVLNIVVNGQEE